MLAATGATTIKAQPTLGHASQFGTLWRLMMSDTAQLEPAHRRPHAPPMASPFLEFDLTAEVNHLRGETT